VDEICTCSPGVTRPCTRAGVCASGVEICTNGLVWSDCTIAPEATDVCNGRDEDCDGTIDEGTAIPCFRDSDNDGFAEAGRPAERRCPDEDRTRFGRCPIDYTNRAPVGTANIDCCDRDHRARPDQTVFFNIRSFCSELNFDFNCDGVSTRQVTAVAAPRRCDYATAAACDAAEEEAAWLMTVPECGVGGILSPGCFWQDLNTFTFMPGCVFTPGGQIQSCR
jgi:hypothetical protein